VIDLTRQGPTRCAQRGGPILSHMSTANVARDLDLLRQAVGDEQLTYLGYSYGTHVGTVYANLFGDRVRALVLDAVLDPVEWTRGGSAAAREQPMSYRLGSFLGAKDALGTFLADCGADARCAFAQGNRDLGVKLDTLLQRLKRRPLTYVDPDLETFQVTYQLAVSFILGGLYSEFNAPVLALVLQDLWLATEERDQRALSRAAKSLRLAPVRPSFSPVVADDEPYYGLEWLPAVLCTDSDNLDNPWDWPRYARRADRAAPYFGSIWTYVSLPCATWPAEDPDRYAGPWDRPTANPLLLIGNSQGDPATPYADAVKTAGRLADARLLTFEAWGHGAFWGASRCIDLAVEQYLILRRLPPQGKVCLPNGRPFDLLPDGAARGPGKPLAPG